MRTGSRKSLCPVSAHSCDIGGHQDIPFNWRATGWGLSLRTFPYKSAHAVIALRTQRDQRAADIASAAGNENDLAADCPMFAGLLPPRGFLFRGLFRSG